MTIIHYAAHLARALSTNAYSFSSNRTECMYPGVDASSDNSGSATLTMIEHVALLLHVKHLQSHFRSTVCSIYYRRGGITPTQGWHSYRKRNTFLAVLLHSLLVDPTSNLIPGIIVLPSATHRRMFENKLSQKQVTSVEIALITEGCTYELFPTVQQLSGGCELPNSKSRAMSSSLQQTV